MADAYITATGRFLPGNPIPNDEIDEYIGSAGRESSSLKAHVLENCGIQTRHYAINKQQETMFSNTSMAAEAVRNAMERADLGPNDVELLSAGTAIPDLLAPGHASMVHGELGYSPMEISTAHGICASGVMALKNAYLQIAAGEKRNAVVVASEFASRVFKSSRFGTMEAEDGAGFLPLDIAFLRYMLSDGAGAAVLQDRPKAEGISLRIDWISLRSYANTEETCMYLGRESNDAKKSWLDYPTVTQAMEDGAITLRQKLLLLPHMARVGVTEYKRLLSLGMIDNPAAIAWFPVHYSSEHLKTALLAELERNNLLVEPEKWYSNLARVGNIGSASIFVILDEMLCEGMIKSGDTLLCIVPESGRFTVAAMHLTAFALSDAEGG